MGGSINQLTNKPIINIEFNEVGEGDKGVMAIGSKGGGDG